MRHLFIIVPLLSLAGLADAQVYRAPGDRAGSWEWSVVGVYQEAESVGAGGGSRVEVDEAFGLGFNAGYYLSNRFMLGAEFDWLRPDYLATLIGEDGGVSTIDHELDQLNFRLKGTLILLEGPFTPYVEFGAGWTYVDSNVADGPPITGCWWHPWWGYICENYYSTFDETSFAYGGAVGLRYKLVGGTILKLGYSLYEIDGSGDAPDPTLSTVRFELAWGF